MSTPSVTAASSVAPPRSPGKARAAVALLFLTNGALFANLLPRYPAIMEDLRLSNAEFGLAVAAFPLGALIAGLASAGLIRRFRSFLVSPPVVGAVADAASLRAGLFVVPLAGLLVLALAQVLAKRIAS